MSSKTWLSATAPTRLPAADIRFYDREGYLIVRGVFSRQEIDRLADDVQRVCTQHAAIVDPCNLRVRYQPHCATGEPVFEVFDPIADLAPAARAVTIDPRILGRLRDLYGEPAELFKDKLIYKPPGAGGAALHQDWIAWPGFPASFLTVLVAIDPFTATSGATEVYPRVHRQGCLSPQDGKFHPLDPERLPCEPVPLLLEPGDIAIFSGFTPHASGPNRDATSRRGYFISYNARSDGGSQYQTHYRQYHQWVRARTPEPKRSRLFFR